MKNYHIDSNCGTIYKISDQWSSKMSMSKKTVGETVTD